jgi:nicotinamide mononucleotide transporter
MPAELTTPLVVEILATGANLAFILLLIREKVLCWPFGIAGSLLSIYLFIDARLYFEAFLYLFYVLFGIWGWLRWHHREEQHDNPVVRWRPALHLAAIVTCSAFAVLLGYGALAFTDAERPFFDAFTTLFSFFATYLEVAKVLEAWVYWIGINLASIWLYHDRNLDIYAGLIGLYAVLSVWGLVSWRRTWKAQAA